MIAAKVSQNGVTDIYGYSRAYLTLGDQEGTYIIRARCEDCLKNQEVVCRGYGYTSQVKADMAGNESANPDDKDENGKPYTPVLKITEVSLPNENKSFTTADGENLLTLKADSLPRWYFLDQSVITWVAQQAPNDFMNSGNLFQYPPQQCPDGKFKAFVGEGYVPPVSTGRSAPLKYRIFARADVDGKTVYSRNTDVRQDEVDKCRQEYIDIPVIGQYVPDYMSKIGRSLFTLGLDGQFVDKDGVVDCYAHIYPSRAGEALRLQEITQPHLYVTSGYRSPRHNAQISGAAPGSTHMFGKGADVAFANVQITPQRMLDLWNVATCPKILERNGTPIWLLVCDSNGDMKQEYLDLLDTDANNNGIPDIFSEAVKLHLGE